MAMVKTVMLATRMEGTSQGVHSRSPSCCGYSGAGTLPLSCFLGDDPPFSTSARDVAIAAGWTT